MTREEKTQVNAMLLARIESLAQYLFPDAEKKQRSWRVGSLDINLRTGMWGDWDGGTESMSRNLIDLWIYATHSNFVTAISEIRNWLPGCPWWRRSCWKPGYLKHSFDAAGVRLDP
jgi:hypothetical protein